MVTRNDVTGDFIQTKGATQKYRDGWDRIFRNKENEKQEIIDESTAKTSDKSSEKDASQ